MTPEKRHTRLSWAIIEAKILYYSPHGLTEAFVNEWLPSDDDYDDMERAYLELCRELGLPNTVVHKAHPGFEDGKGPGMLEVDWLRPSVVLAYKRLCKMAEVPHQAP